MHNGERDGFPELAKRVSQRALDDAYEAMLWKRIRADKISNKSPLPVTQG